MKLSKADVSIRRLIELSNEQDGLGAAFTLYFIQQTLGPGIEPGELKTTFEQAPDEFKAKTARLFEDIYNQGLKELYKIRLQVILMLMVKDSRYGNWLTASWSNKPKKPNIQMHFLGGVYY